MDTLKLMADNEALENEFSDLGKGPCHETIRPDEIFKTERSKNAEKHIAELREEVHNVKKEVHEMSSGLKSVKSSLSA